jgi:hypothetical protein
MTWEEFKLALEYFLYGAVVGYFWNPVWAIIKKIVHEAKVAKNEWRQPRNKDS